MPSPTSWSSVVSVSLTGTQTIDALLSGTRWAGSTITYSFPGNGSSWSTNATTGYGPSNGGQEPWSASFTPLSTPGTGDDQIYFKGALQTWANVANLQFSQVPDTSTIIGDIRAAYTYQNEHANDQAWAYLPAEAASAGDIWFNVIGSSAVDYWTPGGRSYFAVLHELGHVLGLKHPFEAPTTLPASLDSESYTIMSYAAAPGEDSTRFSFNPTTPMLLDIAAIQHLYGANLGFHSGSDNYSYSDSATYHETIWDGGGSDAVQYSGSRNATIDLREGKGSRIGQPVYVQSASGATLYQADNVWIANGAVIENAIGGSGNCFDRPHWIHSLADSTPRFVPTRTSSMRSPSKSATTSWLGVPSSGLKLGVRSDAPVPKKNHAPPGPMPTMSANPSPFTSRTTAFVRSAATRVPVVER